MLHTYTLIRTEPSWETILITLCIFVRLIKPRGTDLIGGSNYRATTLVENLYKEQKTFCPLRARGGGGQELNSQNPLIGTKISV